MSWTACSALCTVSLSLFTAARADARLASRVAGLVVALDEDEDEDEDEPELGLVSLASLSPEPLV